MDRRLQVLTEAFTELQWQQHQKTLDTISENIQNKRFFVAFIGQYSAGKSKLINNLLDRNILPTGVQETTPLLTYIRYGERERARLYYMDGAVREISVEEVGDVIQHSRTWALDQMEYMEVFINAPLLRTGMIFLDTPGINTVIQRHEQLLATSLDLSSKIIYVSGKALHDTDCEMLRMLGERGAGVLYVRTHCDEIKSEEENPEQAVRQDYGVAQSCGVSIDKCYGVSNEKESRWYGGIGSLREELNRMGQAADQLLKETAEEELKKMGEWCGLALKEKADVLEDLKNGRQEKREKKLEEISHKINRFEETIDNRKAKTRSEIDYCNQTIQGRIRREAEDVLDSAVMRLKNPSGPIDTTEEMVRQMTKETKCVVGRIVCEVNLLVSPILQEIRNDLQEECIDINPELLPAIGSFSELEMEQTAETARLCQKFNEVRKKREEIEGKISHMQQSTDLTELQEKLAQAERSIMELQQISDDFPPYVPQMIQIDDGRAQPSQIAKTIGGMADWAMLLIPGGAISGAVVKAAESGKNLSKIAKLIGTIEKQYEIIKKGDSIKDVIYALQHMSKTHATKNRIEKAEKIVKTVANGTESVLKVRSNIPNDNEQASFLDYLTVEYWAEKFGKNFDRPPHYTADQEYEREYQQRKQEIENKIRNSQQSAYQLKCKLNVFNDQQEQLEAQKSAAILDEKKVEAELEKVQKSIEEDARKKAVARWKQNCSEVYRNQMSTQLPDLLKSYQQMIQDRLLRYQDESIQTVMEQLETERNRYQTVQTEASEADKDYVRVTDLLHAVEEMFL